jgi:protein-disulfide isomerase
MKYAQLIIGLFAGTALGGAVIASTGQKIGVSGTADAESIKTIVREVIMAEPQLLIDSLQKHQMTAQAREREGQNALLKDKEIQERLYNDPNAAFVGPKDADAKRTIVEFFDYNCGACKNVFAEIDAIVQNDKDVRVIFHEYPIFGPVSEANSKLGLAVWKHYPEKYYEFHKRMMTHQGRVDEKLALTFAKDLEMDAAKLSAEAATPEMNKILESYRELGMRLSIQGTPTLIIGDELIPHGMSRADMEAKLGGAPSAADKPAEASSGE